jgi:molybdopterin-guanine dinucleotide biosynthesis protein A
MKIACAILSGGKNVRMGGENKAFIKVNDTPIIRRTVDLLKEIFDEIFLVTNSPDQYSLYKKKCHIITDVIKNIGPLGGMHAALSKTTRDAVFFVACDMPYLHNKLILKQIDCFIKTNCDAFVPKRGDLTEPLHAIYRRTLKDDLEYFIKNNSDHSIRSFLKTINVCYWDIEEPILDHDIFCNLNTLEDVKEAHRRGGNENKDLP